MTKWIVGSLVGAIIVFLWQAASWMFLGIHNDEAKYHPAQDSIVGYLSSTIKEDGCYMLPTSPPGSSMDAQDSMMKQMKGKPWASIVYHKSYDTNMTSSMIWGFLVDLVLVLLLISILVRGGLPSFTGIFTGCIAVGLFSFLWEPYMGHVWFQLPWSMIKGHLIDAIAAWALCGLWLAWWLRRPVRP